MARLVIADDSDLLRRTIRKFLFDFPRFEIVGEARDYAETLALVSKVKPDILLLDLRMPGIDSRAELAALASACNCPVVTMTFTTDGEAEFLAQSAGAHRLVDKAHLYDQLVPAIDAALADRDKSRTPQTGPSPAASPNPDPDPDGH